MASPGELTDFLVVDLSVGLPGAYCAKLFADAGAEVWRVEPPDGDPLRRWRWSGEPTPGDGALYRFLRGGQKSVLGAGSVSMEALLQAGDLVIVSGDSPSGSPAELAERLPSTVVVAITPYGLSGPYSTRPASEFTLQADSGALAIRGTADLPPVQMGGRIVEWVGGAYAAVPALAAARQARTTGRGELIDVALCDVANLSGTIFSDMFASLQGRPPVDARRPARSLETPSIEPTKDGWVGFNTNTRDQFESFCLLIERPDLLADGEFASLAVRLARWYEWNSLVRAWTSSHSTEEIVDRAAALRIPVAPVTDGRSVLELDHARARKVFVSDPTGSFQMPRRPYRLAGEDPPPPRPAPAPGRNDDDPRPAPRRPAPTADSGALPLDGLTVLDLTTWWAGPSASGLLAALGARVVHVESTRRMDGARTAGGMFIDRPQWWEYSPFFLCSNANKLGLTLDISHPDGRRLALEMVGLSDVVIENFTPRVLERVDLDWPVIHAVNPRAVMVRMPAFGLDGPWRDRPGFAQTMEQVTGLAWMTGHTEDQPRIQRGPCDPNGGLHAAFATLVALERRDRTGVGCLVEAPMFEAALNVAAEPVVEWSAYGELVGREGNRGPYAVPQNLYATDQPERWLALSCTTDEQFRALAGIIGQPHLADDPELSTLAGRRRRQGALDAVIAEWAATVLLDEALDQLLGAGVPAAPATDPRQGSRHPQMAARGYFEMVDHPVVGRHPTPGQPFRFTGVDRWIRSPAPTLGQHNEEVLSGWLGLDREELAALGDAGVIGTWPHGA